MSKDYVIYGIEHNNRERDEKCKPTVEITNGGIKQKTATVKVTSKSGCGIDSLIGFFVQQ